MRRLFLALLAVASLLAAGCSLLSNPIPGLLVTKSAKEREITALKADYEAKIGTARQEVGMAKDRVIAGKDAQMDGAATALYGQDRVFRSILTPTRTDLITHNLGTEAWAALGNRPPTAEGMRLMNERLAKELDATRTSLADLQANHAAALVQNAALAEATRKHQQDLAALETKLTAVQKEGADKLAAKQGELIETQGRLIAAEKARADDRAALQALKTRASIALGLLAIAALAAAVYLPAFRGESALFGALCGGAAIGIWWLQPWHIAAAVGVAVLATFGWMALKHRRKERATDALALTVQDLRDKGGDIAAVVEATVADRTSRYKRAKDGTVTLERDPAVEREIQSTLADYDALPAAPAKTA